MAHLYGYEQWGGETYRFKVTTLKKGSWFGDYQIMVNVESSWDLEAGGDHEFDKSKKPKGVAPDHILVYTIRAERLRKILNRDPVFRSFVITRSVTRRAYFTKLMEDSL